MGRPPGRSTIESACPAGGALPESTNRQTNKETMMTTDTDFYSPFFVEVNRGAEPTRHQRAVEAMVRMAEAAMPGIAADPGPHVPEPVWAATRALACMLSEIRAHCGDGPAVLTDPAASCDGKPYRMTLEVGPAATPDARDWNRVLQDGFGPYPLDHLEGFRLRAALPGLLRLALHEAEIMSAGDFNWDDEDEEVTLDEEWHPDRIIERLRSMITDATRDLAS